jgi:hypothetical protein
MINPMAAIKSESNRETGTETLSDHERSDYERIVKRLDHLDEGIHEIHRDLVAVLAFIEANQDAIARAKTFLDPGAKLRSAMGMKPKKA